MEGLGNLLGNTHRHLNLCLSLSEFTFSNNSLPWTTDHLFRALYTALLYFISRHISTSTVKQAQLCVLCMTSGVGELVLPLTVVSIATALTQEALKLQGEGLWQGSGFLALTGRVKWESVTGLPSGLFHSVAQRKPQGSLPGCRVTCPPFTHAHTFWNFWINTASVFL